MNIKTIAITDYKPASYNPRRRLKPSDPEYQKLSRSIDEFGLLEPIVVNIRTGHVVCGNQRVKVMKKGIVNDKNRK